MKKTGNGKPEQCAVNILRIVRGEVPFDRLRGVDGSMVDKPSGTAAPLLREDMRWALEIYEPRMATASVDVLSEDAANGHFNISAAVE